ncbi:MAG: hypothetical protein ABFE01_04530, partial [Phycisphaerales bacterium]
MSSNNVRIVAEGAEFILEFPHRDWLMLAGPPPFIPGAEHFVKILGVFDNFTVARGIPKGSKATRTRGQLIAAATILLETIQRDLDLLEYDYSYSFSAGEKPRGTGG